MTERSRWEYMVIQQNNKKYPILGEEILNKVGQEGWELISVVIINTDTVYTFKRNLLKGPF